jgi:hypothetical protein
MPEAKKERERKIHDEKTTDFHAVGPEYVLWADDEHLCSKCIRLF